MVIILNKLRKRTVEEDIARRTTIVNEVKSLNMKIKKLDSIILGDELDHSALQRYMKQLGDHLREIDSLKLKLSELDNITYNPLPESLVREVALK